jgi:hypothetical protein
MRRLLHALAALLTLAAVTGCSRVPNLDTLGGGPTHQQQTLGGGHGMHHDDTLGGGPTTAPAH